ncbi:MAG: ribonuclease III [Planctomycetales bacterium]|nr:ribonuclease III [Planctomycetales bacterium]
MQNDLNSDSTPDLDACQDTIQYRFRDPELLESALKHASGVSHRLASNERMEFLGDAILGMVVCEQLYLEYPDYLEGEMTKVKSVVVSRDTCARVCEKIGLHEYLMLGKGMAADPRIPRSVIAAAFESLIAAIYLDSGMESAREFILKHIEAEIAEAASSESGGNYKSQLQQFAQREHGVTPGYQLLDEKGPDHSKCFKVAAFVAQQRFEPAWGKSKKESEQRAAHNAISELNDEPVPYPSDAPMPPDLEP